MHEPIAGATRRPQASQRGRQEVALLVHSLEDEAIVSAQLQRTLRGKWAVAKRCHLGVPMAIENHPVLDDGAPFPTLFWLTCPVLLKRVSQLEAGGGMAQLNERLANDPGLKARLTSSVEALRARRDTHAVIEGSGAPPGGGADKVKCLHAHTAQELALPGDPAGALALAATGWPDCQEPCFSVQIGAAG
ncbi:MAG: DUF501 domain-containing protein [Actinomycetota bacterium]